MRRRHLLNHPWMYQAGVAMVRRLPRGFNRLWVRRIADLNYWRLTRHRGNVCGNLAPLLGEDRRRLCRAAHRLFRNYAEIMVDYAFFFGGPTPDLEGFFRVAEGAEHVERALEAGRGVVLVTAHLGFWELGSLFFRGRDLPMHVLTLEDPDPGVHAERERLRAGLGIETITVGNDPWGSLAVARALRNNGVVAMLVDRYEGPDAVPVELFGRCTHFAPGPALYARLARAAVIPAFVLSEGRGLYRGLIQPPVPMEFSEDRAGDLRRNTQRLATAIGQVIRAYPEQWYNFEPIWREP